MSDGIRVVSEEEMVRGALAFARQRKPGSLFYLHRLKPAIFVMHLMGCTQAVIHEHLLEQRLSNCSLNGFKKWLAANCELDADSLAFAKTRPDLNLQVGFERLSAANVAPSSGGAETSSAGDGSIGAAIHSDGGASLRERQIALLDASLDGLAAQEMGTVAARALDSLDRRDRGS